MSGHLHRGNGQEAEFDSAPLRVLHVIASSGLYGIERMLLGLLPELKREGCQVRLVCLSALSTPGAEVGEAVSAASVPVDYVPLDGRFSLKGLLGLYQTITAFRPHVVHVHGYKATILAGALSLARRVPTVATFHTEVKLGEVSQYVGIESQILRRFRGIAAVSDAISQELEDRGVSADRVCVIPNGIHDVREDREGIVRAHDVPPGRPLLFSAARLSEGKNIQLLIEVVAGLRARFPNMCLLVAGEGPYRPRLEETIRRLGLQGSVRLLGYVEVHRYLIASDCFVLPSKLEGMPISLLEAMSLSTPIVASAVGSIPSMVKDGVEAILVEPSNKQELASALERILGDRALQALLASNARRKFLREYTAGKMAARYVRFYKRSLTGAAHSHLVAA